MSAMEPPVAVSDTSIKRRIRGGHGSIVVLLAKPRARSDDATELVRNAVKKANASPDHRGAVNGDCVFAADAGAMFHLEVDDWDDGTRAWLSNLAAELDGSGWSGTILAPSASWYPQAAWRFRDSHPAWFGHLALTQTRRSLGTYGYDELVVADRTIEQASRYAVSWIQSIEGTHYLMPGVPQIKIGKLLPASEVIAIGVRKNQQIGASTLNLKPLAERRVHFGYGNRIDFTAKGIDELWPTSVTALREALVSLGHLADWASVHHASDFHEQRGGVERGLDHLAWRENRFLWRSLVPDPYGIQVLTCAHLERATRLDGWKITPLGHDRHLVEAEDIEPWYATAKPDPAVRAQARDDFGAMLMTEHSIRADPNGWYRGMPPRVGFLD